MRLLARPRLLISIALVLGGVVALAWPSPVAAHPLGNFTVNHYTRIDVTEDGLAVYRVLDMAEIPAFQERGKLDTNGDGAVDAAEGAAYGAATARALSDGMAVRINGDDVTLDLVTQHIAFPEGQGGLTTLRLAATYAATLPDGWRDGPARVEFSDRNYTDRIGWREVVVRGGPGVELADSGAPAASISDELRSYPEGLLSSPPDVRDVQFSFSSGIGAALPAQEAREDRAVRGNPDGTLTRFASLVDGEELGLGVMAIALLSAVGFGAIHALSPGHGKTVVAAYLVGSRGTAWHALLLGLVVTATHTSSVYALGFVTLYLSEYIVPETLYPWLGIASGGLILVMGLSLLVGRLRSSGLASDALRRLRALPATRPAVASGESGAMRIALPLGASAERTYGEAHEHPHAGDQDATTAHSHGIGPAHSHVIPGQDGEPVRWQSLVGLGIFGGILPCPSAIVVMLSAIALHRVAFGLLLIVAFSIGLAGVLTAIGFALVYARSISSRVPALRRLGERARDGGFVGFAVRAFPVASAAAVVAAGVVITLRALAQQGTL